jgi:sugar transferase (PEP-CTERM/EpsH1 system associated)
MRVLYLTHRLPYAPNHPDRIRPYHVLRHLSRRHTVDLVSIVADDREASRAFELRDLADSVTTARVGRLQRAARMIAALAGSRPLTPLLVGDADVSRLMGSCLERVRPDVVLAHGPAVAPIALDPSVADLPLILDMAEVGSERWARLGLVGRVEKQWLYRRKASSLRGVERAAARAAHATLVDGEAERQVLADMGIDSRVLVVPSGVDRRQYRSPLAPVDEPRVVFCGAANNDLNEAAAVWLARDIWPRVRDSRPEASLRLVGTPDTWRVVELARRDHSIEIAASVADVRPFLWRSAVAVAPLAIAWGSHHRVLEATAAGLPSVVTGAVLESLPPEVSPACVRADDVDAFAYQIRRLLSMSGCERNAVARRARLDALDWERRLAALESILEPFAPAERRTA